MKNKNVITNRISLESGRSILLEFWKCDSVINVPIFKNDKEKYPVGRATLVSVPEIDYVIMVDITIFDVENRRKGYARDLMKTLTDIFPRIATSHISKAGLNLCLNAGFVLKKKMFAAEEDLLLYTREGAPDGSNSESVQCSEKDDEESRKESGKEVVQKNNPDCVVNNATNS